MTTEPAPAPQRVINTQSYVQVEVPTVEERARQAAEAEYARRFPGAVAHIEAINAMAQQIASGMRK